LSFTYGPCIQSVCHRSFGSSASNFLLSGEELSSESRCFLRILYNADKEIFRLYGIICLDFAMSIRTFKDISLFSFLKLTRASSTSLDINLLLPLSALFLGIRESREPALFS
jgi:hypothetical protein